MRKKPFGPLKVGLRKGSFVAFESHQTDLSDPVTPRKGPALVAIVAAHALLCPLLRPERQFLVVCLKI